MYLGVEKVLVIEIIYLLVKSECHKPRRYSML